MLSERLRSLESEGLVLRAVIPETPVRVEYELTKKGRELQAALREIAAWAERWIPLEHTSGESESSQRHHTDRPARKLKHA
jgi:DNA-binding HxlR family transcriptional regulator